MNWKKIWKVTKIVAGIGGTVLFVCSVVIAVLGGPAGGNGSLGSGSGSGYDGGGSVWTVGSGRTKKFGSHSSFRHK